MKEKISLEEELIHWKKKLAKIIVENSFLLKDLCKVEDKNKELKEKLKLFDEVKKKNEDLEENLKRLEEQNNLQLKEIKTLKDENECLKYKASVCDVNVIQRIWTRHLISVFLLKKCDKDCQKKW